MKTFSYLSLTAAVLAQQYSRRGYYDDVACAGTFTVGISVPNAGTCGNAPGTLTKICVVKGQDPNLTGTLKSSESSGCSAAPGGISDAVWLAGAGEGKLKAGAPYLTVNAYSDAACTSSKLAEQNTFLADGACYAVEYEKSFYMASCTASSAVLKVCSDSRCTVCDETSDLNAGIYQVKGFTSATNQCVSGNGWAMTKVICTNPAGSLSVGPASGSSGSGSSGPGTTSTSGSSGTSGAPSATTSSGAAATASTKSDAAANSVFGTLFVSLLALFV
ncbi:hypothetical protein HDU91_005737 [Kappamyces sp. JEL0680]|nr:hypothetical protein HDU91_005737 [Kappamyces sp. JEL0680]